MSSLRTSIIVWLALACLGMAGCGSDPGFNEETDFIPKEGAAQFVNMMADSPELSIRHGVTTFLVGFPGAGPIEPRFEDSYDWRIGYLRDNQEVIVISGENQIVSETDLTTFLISGTVAQPAVEIVDRPVGVSDDIQTDQSEVWFAFSSARYSMVDVYLLTNGEDLTTAAPLATIDDGAFTNLFTVTAGADRELSVTEAGTTEVLFNSTSLEIAAQSRELFAIVDDFGPDGSSHVDVIRSIAGTTMPDEAQPTLLRVDNFSSAEPVDVTVGGTIFTAVTRNSPTSYQAVDVAISDLSIEDGSGTLLEGDETLTRNRFLSLLVFDDTDPEATATIRTTTILDDLRPITDRSVFQFVNGTGTVVHLYALRAGETVENSQPTLANVSFGSSGSLEVSPTQLEFVAVSVESSETLATLATSLELGVNHTLVLDTANEFHFLSN